jgi:hypothetical protein
VHNLDGAGSVRSRSVLDVRLLAPPDHSRGLRRLAVADVEAHDQLVAKCHNRTSACARVDVDQRTVATWRA